MKKIQAIRTANQTSFKGYQNRLFTDVVTNNDAMVKSVNEILLMKTMSYGCEIDDAKEDLKRILCVRVAVGVLLKRAVSNMIIDVAYFIRYG